jgi:hypothetical protein
MTALATPPKLQFLDANGAPLVGGKLYTYAAGTTTPQVTYTDFGGGTANANPVILDSRGEASVWLGTALYKMALYSATNVLIWTVDNIGGFATLAQLAASGGSSLVGYLPAGTGAVATTVQAKLRESVSVKDFGAVGDGVTDDTAAIQAAINTGFDLIFPDGGYNANNLTQSTNFQRFYASGQVNIIKNANGALFTGSGNYVEFNGIQFLGTGYTGNNVVLTGSNPRLLNCSSYGTPGRALKATGDHVQIIGTSGIYATTDATGTGYDIEIGVSGTSTLYHQLSGVYSSQVTGGILLIDTGSHVISGGQFGKLTIQSGTSPAGVNGGMTIGARILGNVSVGLSSAILSANQFSAVNVNFLVGTASCRLDASNVYAVGATVTNSGNTNNLIIREVSTGSTQQLKFGPDTSTAILTIDGTDPTAQWLFSGGTVLPNNRAYKTTLASGTVVNAASMSTGNVLSFGNVSVTRVDIAGPSINMNTSAGTQVQVTDGEFRPFSDNAKTLGTAALRWSVVYAATGTINTSDGRSKQDLADLDIAERRVAIALKGLVKKFRFKDSVQVKGDAARIHVGVVAQEVIAAFEAEGLDANRYAIVCYDEWEAEEDRPAGNRYGVRYEELLAFIISAL